jgi:hypothetical protein
MRIRSPAKNYANSAHIDVGDPREASHDAKNAEDVLHHVRKLFLQLPRSR